MDMNPITLAQAIPVKIRQVVYSVLATLFAMEFVLDLVDDGLEVKIIGVLGALGFAVARVNTSAPLPPPPVDPFVEPNFPDEFA